MRKIKIKTEDLEIVAENFLYASKEAGEVNYRINQLGNELVDDPDLLICPEYQDIMANYTSVKKSIQKINEKFDIMTSSVLKAAEMYAEAEYKNKERIEGLLKRIIKYHKAVTDESDLERIVKSAEGETEINGIADMVDKSHQSTLASAVNAESVNAENENQPYDNDATGKITESFINMEIASSAAEMKKDGNEG